MLIFDRTAAKKQNKKIINRKKSNQDKRQQAKQLFALLFTLNYNFTNDRERLNFLGKFFKLSLDKVIFFLLFLQLFYSLIVIGRYMFFESDLILWTRKNYTFSQKVETIRGAEYTLAQGLKDLPENVNFLATHFHHKLWFLNYYLFPHKIFFYPGVINDQNIGKILGKWVEDRNIKYIIFYHPPVFKVKRITMWNKAQ